MAGEIGRGWNRAIDSITDCVYGPVPEYGDEWPGLSQLQKDRVDRICNRADVEAVALVCLVVGGILLCTAVMAGFVVLVS